MVMSLCPHFFGPPCMYGAFLCNSTASCLLVVTWSLVITFHVLQHFNKKLNKVLGECRAAADHVIITVESR